ncbi:RNA polymerase sigma-70 factor (sigma-E family) [Kribbella sp. VKM Ac-2527]|uniref:RNA polymerase sigma-70 factor (Sigma-E family) n=1 Tax=Kribbella caucasensis TaxID=2512215 RepID=A0A4R6KJH4_9ACTN|nr:SigE family RNA polymerase sigma factor [Kribbella sp. VKM Ac-2527]TDO51454.1 RNA polymerase sigma-70 factor (sigma-E family) [Kribbella sp. VKM Ac-2527]
MRPTNDFEEFARARTPHLYRTAWLLAGDRYHAEDLVQETLAKMFRAWRGIQRIDNPAAYAQTVLARTFVSQRRRRSWSEQPTEVLPDRVERPGDHELRLSLQQALAELAPLDRAVLVLRFFEDRSVEQVALDLGKNAGAIRTRTSRALDRLRTVLGDDVNLIAL